MPPRASLGIIGGTGLYELGLLKDSSRHKVYTPFGEPSDQVTVGTLGNQRVAFIPRHGSSHRLLPHSIPYRANIWALKEAGVSRILSLSAVGSLREKLRPGGFVTPHQFIDFTKNRISSFYSTGEVCHVSTADPFCADLRASIAATAKTTGLQVHGAATYVCIEGPRFSTKAESKMFRIWGADVIGMTLVPECVLAREMRMCFANLATITDYDVWSEKPVEAQMVAAASRASQSRLKLILEHLIPRITAEGNCACEESLENAIY